MTLSSSKYMCAPHFTVITTKQLHAAGRFLFHPPKQFDSFWNLSNCFVTIFFVLFFFCFTTQPTSCVSYYHFFVSHMATYIIHGEIQCLIDSNQWIRSITSRFSFCSFVAMVVSFYRITISQRFLLCARPYVQYVQLFYIWGIGYM